MEKRLFIAVMLSIAFLFAWGAILPRVFPKLAKPKAETGRRVEEATGRRGDGETGGRDARPISRPVVASPGTPVSPSPRPPVSPSRSEPVQAGQLQESVIETDDFTARFSNRGAQLISFKLKKYQQTDSPELVDLVRPRDSKRTDFPFSIVSANSELTERVNRALYLVEEGRTQLVYRYTDPTGLTVSKSFKFTDRYRFHFEVSLTPEAPPYRVVIGPGIRALGRDEEEGQFTRTGNAVIQRDGSFEIIRRDKVPQFKVFEGAPEFVGLEDNYFLAVLQPEVSGSASLRATELPSQKGGPARKEVYAGLNAVNGRVTGKAFFGPKEVDLLTNYQLDKALQFGLFGPIARGLLYALREINKLTHNYGWAIIVLTVIIKILLYPLQHKSIVSMKKMQKLQPRMLAIKEKYKKAKSDPDQRQKMNTEMMKLYQQEGINPMSGCLPILLQLPILWAFYSLLSVSIELRGADFMLWIRDLSAKDPYYITPILMTITMFIQQWMTPTTADPTQRKVFLAMPFIFGWIFKEFPSGLVLYWLVQNILSIVQQSIMNRYWKEHPDDPAPPPGSTKGAARMKLKAAS